MLSLSELLGVILAQPADNCERRQLRLLCEPGFDRKVPKGAVDGCWSGAMETAAKRASSACRCIGPGSKARMPVRACRRQAVIRLR